MSQHSNRPRLGTTSVSRAIQRLAKEILKENDWSRHLSEFVGPDTKQDREIDNKRKRQARNRRK